MSFLTKRGAVIRGRKSWKVAFLGAQAGRWLPPKDQGESDRQLRLGTDAGVQFFGMAVNLPPENQAHALLLWHPGSTAVPFSRLENVGGDSADEYFADGLTDELIRNLSDRQVGRPVPRGDRPSSEAAMLINKKYEGRQFHKT